MWASTLLMGFDEITMALRDATAKRSTANVHRRSPPLNIPLLHRLRDARGAFVPLAELGEPLDAVRADLDALERFGFVIERHPYRGAAYREPATRLCPDQIEHALDPRRVGRRVTVWSRVGSTNDLAARAAGSAANEGLVVLAEEQAAGRGRRGRTWVAPPCSSILMSVLLFPPGPLDEVAWLTALGAVAVAEVVAETTGLDARIKWPNDVRVAGKKVAGVLVERGAGAVIGIGLNANAVAADFADGLAGSASSLRILTGSQVDRSELARALILRLDHWYDQAWSLGPSSLDRPWRDRSEHLGAVVRVETRTGSIVGRLDDLDLRRGLSLTTAEGHVASVASGDIVALAAADATAGP